MIDQITGEPITVEDLRREIVLIRRQIEAARTEEVEIVFRELLARHAERRFGMVAMIPRTLWANITDSLVYFRTHPCRETDLRLLQDEERACFPYLACAEQMAEWGNICDRTRVEFERLVITRKGASCIG